MLLIGSFLIFMICQFVSGAPPQQKTTTSQLSEGRKIELAFNSLCDNLHTVFDDEAATSFLNRTLDESLMQMKNKPMLNSVNFAVRTIAENLADKELTKLLRHALLVVDNIFTNGDYHKFVKESIQLFYLTVSDPASLEMAERTLMVTLENMKSKHILGIVEGFVNQLAKEREMQRTLDGLALGMQSLSGMITNPDASQQIMKALKWVSSPEAKSVNNQQNKAPPTRSISIKPRVSVRVDSQRHPR